MARGIRTSSNKKGNLTGFYLDQMQTEVVNNEDLFIKLSETTEDSLKIELTERIVRNNLNSIRYVILKRYGTRLEDILKRNRMTYDDLFSLGCGFLMVAIKKFDLSMGFKFTTLLYKILHNGYSKFFQRLKTPDTNVSMDAPLGIATDGTDLVISDIIADKSEDADIVKCAVDNDLYSSILEELDSLMNPKHMAIFKAHLTSNYTQIQLGEMFGVTQVQISRVIRKAQQAARDIRERTI